MLLQVDPLIRIQSVIAMLPMQCERFVYVVLVNAPLHTLQKDYISRYTERWPSASMLVIRAFTPWLVLSQNEKASRA